MALVLPDLSSDITINGVSLNNVTTATSGGKLILSGNRVDYMDVGPEEVVQFTEKLALADGLDYGPLYKGGRQVEVRGTSFASTRALAYAAVSTIEAAVDAASGGYGLVALVFSSGGSSKSMNVRPNGLHVPVARGQSGGVAGDAISIEWSFTALAMNPAIT